MIAFPTFLLDNIEQTITPFEQTIHPRSLIFLGQQLHVQCPWLKKKKKE